jgi:hypothetical protein
MASTPAPDVAEAGGAAVAASDALAAATATGDVSAVNLADDVVLASPVVASFKFEGRDDVLTLLTQVHDAVEDYEYLGAFGEGEVAALHFRAQVRGQSIEGLDMIRVDGSGAITEVRVFARPLPAVAALLRELGPRVARPQGRWRAALTALLTAPLVFLTKSGDRISERLTGRRRR